MIAAYVTRLSVMVDNTASIYNSKPLLNACESQSNEIQQNIIFIVWLRGKSTQYTVVRSPVYSTTRSIKPSSDKVVFPHIFKQLKRLT